MSAGLPFYGDGRRLTVVVGATLPLVPDITRGGVVTALGETDRALDVALPLIHDRPGFNAEFLFAAETQELRTNPRFAELIRAIGLHRYWENFGWPEACRADGEQIVCH